MDLYQVRYKTSTTSSFTDWYLSIAEARKDAMDRNMPIGSEIVQLKLVGHEAMVEAIHILMNAKEPIDPAVKFLRNLGSAREVKKRKVISRSRYAFNSPSVTWPSLLPVLACLSAPPFNAS